MRTESSEDYTTHSSASSSSSQSAGADSSTGPSSVPGSRACSVDTSCAYFLRTGTCAYGDRCRFLHPPGTRPPTLNSRGYPSRPGEAPCPFYSRRGWCGFQATCKYDHTELVTDASHQSTAAGPPPPRSVVDRSPSTSPAPDGKQGHPMVWQQQHHHHHHGPASGPGSPWHSPVRVPYGVGPPLSPAAMDPYPYAANGTYVQLLPVPPGYTVAVWPPQVPLYGQAPAGLDIGSLSISEQPYYEEHSTPHITTPHHQGHAPSHKPSDSQIASQTVSRPPPPPPPRHLHPRHRCHQQQAQQQHQPRWHRHQQPPHHPQRQWQGAGRACASSGQGRRTPPPPPPPHGAGPGEHPGVVAHPPSPPPRPASGGTQQGSEV